MEIQRENSGAQTDRESGTVCGALAGLRIWKVLYQGLHWGPDRDDRPWGAGHWVP